MSSYKVIQDIEAEDKLIGPLTLRQSIYGGITLVCLYLCFIGYAKHSPVMIAIFLPIGAITGFFAFPWKGEQPTEIWALARLRFMIIPRVRVWDQSGVKDVVTVLAPRKLEVRRPLTNNLSENEVRSRLKALADTIDSRGWATRNASYALYSSQYQSRVNAPGQSVPTAAMPAVDMFDEQSNVAQNFDAMLARSAQDQRQRVMLQMSQAAQPQQPMPQQMPQQGYQQPVQAQYQQRPVQNYAGRQGPQLPAPVMPSLPAPMMPPTMANPNGPPPGGGAGNFWFANGPAYPGNSPAQISNQQQGMSPMPPQYPQQPQQPQQPLNDPQSSMQPEPAQPVQMPPIIPDEYTAAVAMGKISTDVPIPGVATPNSEEEAFAQAARQQNEEFKKRYGHVTVDPNSGAVLQPTPSVPGMIDYGRPQPADDQMQYDTSMPQSSPQPAAQQPQAAQSQPQDQQTLPAVPPVTPPTDPAILGLAKNDDLDVATIARQVNKEMKGGPGEVEIQLH